MNVMIYTVQNEKLRVSADTAGAQLMSVQGTDGVERLWQGDPAIWGRRAPILFPFIGRLKNSTYTVNSRSYQICSHGFARDSEWTLDQKTANTMTFMLRSSAETMRQYPFAFTCAVTYALDGDTVVKTHTVCNRSDETMYYEIGGHDGFRTTLAAGEVMADSYVEIPGVDALHPIINDENLMLTQEKRTVPLQNGRLYLRPGLFAQDALILDDLPERRITLGSDKNGYRITVRFQDYPYVGIWSRPVDYDTNYVCIEPWSTLPDAAYLGMELERKTGVRSLAPGETESLRYDMQFIAGG